jgi:ankyrin repeat protein
LTSESQNDAKPFQGGKDVKRYFLVYTALIASLCVNSFAKEPAPEAMAKTREIINAIEKKDLAGFKELIKNPAAINLVAKGSSSETFTPLTRAVSFYDLDKTIRLEMVTLLLKAGASADYPDDSKMTPLMYAASYGIPI